MRISISLFLAFLLVDFSFHGARAEAEVIYSPAVRHSPEIVAKKTCPSGKFWNSKKKKCEYFPHPKGPK